jgi:hypothetical protein
MPKYNYKNLLFYERHILIYVNGVRQKTGGTNSTQPIPSEQTDGK